MHKFDVQFGLPDPPSFLKLDQFGGTNYPGPDPTGGWEVEESLDVEWAHALAPKANIILFEANDASNNLFTAVNTARYYPGVTVVSNSWGSSEFAGETAFDGIFTTPAGHVPVTFLASTGDYGAPGLGYPAYSPNVVAVGGTTLQITPVGNWVNETGWGNGNKSSTLGGSGGGISLYEAKPSYQMGTVAPVTQSATQRCIPDVALDADPDTGVPVCDSYTFPPATPWVTVGGTSFACPAWAAIISIADQARARLGQSSLNGPTQTLPLLYSLSWNDFHDILTGNNGFPCGPGYDLVTGRGTPRVQDIVPGLVGAIQNKLNYPLRYIYNPLTQTYSGQFTISTNSLAPIQGPFVIWFPSLPAGVSLANANTTVNGHPGIIFSGTLSLNSPLKVELVFSDPLNVSLGSSFYIGFGFYFGPTT